MKHKTHFTENNKQEEKHRHIELFYPYNVVEQTNHMDKKGFGTRMVTNREILG